MMKASTSIAIVEDDQKLAEVIRTTIKYELHVEVKIFLKGEILLNLMEEGSRFDIYILDYQLDRYHNILWGDEVALEILRIDRTAKIIGISSDAYESIFTNLGAEFVLKASVKPKIVKTIRVLLNIK